MADSWTRQLSVKHNHIRPHNKMFFCFWGGAVLSQHSGFLPLRGCVFVYEIFPPLKRLIWFYSCCFTAVKKNGGVHSIVDLKQIYIIALTKLFICLRHHWVIFRVAPIFPELCWFEQFPLSKLHSTLFWSVHCSSRVGVVRLQYWGYTYLFCQSSSVHHLQPATM